MPLKLYSSRCFYGRNTRLLGPPGTHHSKSSRCIHYGILQRARFKLGSSKNKRFSWRSLTQIPVLIKTLPGYSNITSRHCHSKKRLFDLEWNEEHILSQESLTDLGLGSDTSSEELYQLNQKILFRVKSSWPLSNSARGGGSGGLQDLLLRYMETVYLHTKGQNTHRLDKVLNGFFDDGSFTFLESRGHDVLDVGLWAWILSESSTEKAALRLFAAFWVERNAYSRIPPFVLLSLLQRPHVTPSALRCLILCVWDYFKVHRSSHPGSSNIGQVSMAEAPDTSLIGKAWMSPSKKNSIHRTMSEVTIVDFVTELIRHARQSWPAAMTNIVLIFTEHIIGDGLRKDNLCDLSKDFATRLSLLCNRMLSYIALPSVQHPWRSIPYHQKAQLHIIRYMNEFQPALTVTREGYRALIFVQLLHRKTTQEIEWAELKARSWPPWKEDKLGLDVEKSIEMGVSRASEVMSKLQEAGYHMLEWETAAKIYAGWDTDNSPTIQVRSREGLPFSASGPRRLEWSKSTPESKLFTSNRLLWTARVRATRTLAEAWACFLTYRKYETTPLVSVYFALLEKIVFDEERVRHEKRKVQREEKEVYDKGKGEIGERTVKNVTRYMKNREKALEDGEGDLEDDREAKILCKATTRDNPYVLAGDGKEVMSPPVSPRESVYLPVPPPTLAQFFENMIDSGIKPSGRILAFLLRQARFYNEGMKYLESSSLPGSVIRTLQCRESLDAEQIRERLDPIPNYLFAAYIQFISRFSSRVYLSSIRVLRISELAKLGEGKEIASKSSQIYGPLTIPHTTAFRLLLAQKTLHRPAWYALLEALLQPKRLTQTGMRHHDRSIADELVSWKIMTKLLMQMDYMKLNLDFDGFHFLCKGLERALKASRQFVALLNRDEISTDSNERESYVLGDANAELTKELRTFAESLLWRRASELKARFWNISSSFETVKMSVEPSLGSLRKKLVDHEANARLKGLPKLLDIPAPMTLHAYVRALGIAEDFGAIRGLCQWMADHASEISSVADELSNGRRNLRRTLTAVRVFLERSWLEYGSADEIADGDEGKLSEDGATEKLLRKTRKIVETMEYWGGWPTDEEVEIYCHSNKFL